MREREEQTRWGENSEHNRRGWFKRRGITVTTQDEAWSEGEGEETGGEQGGEKGEEGEKRETMVEGWAREGSR